MSKSLVPKADGIKHSRDLVLQARSLERTKSGEWPKRMRGYYRAIKREEPWAIALSKKDPFGFILSWTYRAPMIKEVLCAKNPFLEMVEKKESSWGGYLPVQFGKK